MRAVGNDRQRPAGTLEHENEASLGRSLAPLEGGHSEEIDHRPTDQREGLAAA